MESLPYSVDLITQHYVVKYEMTGFGLYVNTKKKPKITNKFSIGNSACYVYFS